MLRPAIYSVVLILCLSLLLRSAGAREYFTEDELDIIRDAQELKARVPAFFMLAERRLIILGVAEKSEKQKEKERKQQEQYEKEKKKAGPKASSVKPPVDELAYLHDFTRAELLRGYIEAIDEVMNNIDDNYQRKLDVRGAIEDLEKFTRETQPLLEKFQPANEAEKLALQDAMDKATQANNGAKEALKTVPKTEKKP
jgi:hypothetical protein